MARLLFGVLPLILFFGSSAQAAGGYCWYSGGKVSDGQTVGQTLKIVVASVDRPYIPGQPNRRPWCIQDWRSLGCHLSGRIIERPKLGQVNANGYRVSYRGDRVGQDRFVVELRLLNWSNNQWWTGRIAYDVEVLAQPM